jgi:hypothetical protein
MVGLLSQVMDNAIVNVYVNVVIKKTQPVCAREVKDNVGVLAVLAMHSRNANKNIERMCAREVLRNDEREQCGVGGACHALRECVQGH